MAKLTDNKLEQIKIYTDGSITTLQTFLVDLHLQKLEAAKIEEIEFFGGSVSQRLEDASGQGSGTMAVINDPDDVTSLEFPDGESQHDIIASYSLNVEWVLNVAVAKDESVNHIDFDEDEDVYALRNLRVNCQWSNNLTSHIHPWVLIKFRREAVKVSDYTNIIENL